MDNCTNHIVEFTLIYNQFKAKLYNYAIKMVNDTMVCEDLIQNTFLKLFENLDVIRKMGSVQYWLFTTARNEIFTYYRKKKVRVNRFNAEDADENDLPAEESLDLQYELKELKELINYELSRMPVEQRDVFLLKEYGELSYKEIASLLNIDAELVKSRLFKARRKLIKRLSGIFKNN